MKNPGNDAIIVSSAAEKAKKAEKSEKADSLASPVGKTYQSLKVGFTPAGYGTQYYAG